MVATETVVPLSGMATAQAKRVLWYRLLVVETLS